MAMTSLEGSGQAGVADARTDLLERFETIYREADGDCSRIPWAHARACPFLMNWLDAEGPSYVRPGARVCVVGCGLGMDAAALVERGYDVTAFDACSCAIESARQLHPDLARSFVHRDLFDDPGKYRHRFDMVVEVHTLQSMPPEMWLGMAKRMSELVSTRGVMVVVARGRDAGMPSGVVDGPPYPLTQDELLEALEGCGFEPVRAIDNFMDDNSPAVRRLRGCFRRSG